MKAGKAARRMKTTRAISIVSSLTEHIPSFFDKKLTLDTFVRHFYCSISLN